MTKQTEPGMSAVKYFGSFATYKVPIRPTEPLSKEEAEKRAAYYVAYYNQKNLLSQIEKYLHGKLDWKEEYTYWESGSLKTQTVTRSDNSITTNQFKDSLLGSLKNLLKF